MDVAEPQRVHPEHRVKLPPQQDNNTQPSPFDVTETTASLPETTLPTHRSFPTAFQLPPRLSNNSTSPSRSSANGNEALNNNANITLPSQEQSLPEFASSSQATNSSSLVQQKSWVKRVQARTDEVRKLFSLPTSEQLMDDYVCALRKRVLLQGRMYVFEHHLCFYSSLFGHHKVKIIPLENVLEIRKRKNVGFPNSIEVTWASPPRGEPKKEFFTSFISREDAYRLLLGLWAQVSEHGRQRLADTEGHTDEDALTVLNPSSNNNNNSNNIAAVATGVCPVLTSGGGLSNTVKTAKRLIKSVKSGKLTSRVQTTTTSSSSSSSEGNESDAADSVSGDQDWVEPCQYCPACPEESFMSDQDLGRVPVAGEEKDADDELSQGERKTRDGAAFEVIIPSSGNRPTTIDVEFETAHDAPPPPPPQMQRVLQYTLPCTSREFWTEFMSNKSDFFIKFHEKQGHFNIRLAPWQRHMKVGNVRDLRFVSLFKGWRVGGQLEALCHQTHRYRIYKGDYLVFETSQVMSEIPYSDHFKVETRWDVAPMGAAQSQISVYFDVPFIKQTMWRKFIEKSVTDNIMDALGVFKELAPQQIANSFGGAAVKARTPIPTTAMAQSPPSVTMPLAYTAPPGLATAIATPLSAATISSATEDTLPESNEEWEVLLAQVDPHWRGGLRSLRKMQLQAGAGSGGGLTPVRSLNRRRHSRGSSVDNGLVMSMNTSGSYNNLGSVAEDSEERFGLTSGRSYQLNSHHQSPSQQAQHQHHQQQKQQNPKKKRKWVSEYLNKNALQVLLCLLLFVVMCLQLMLVSIQLRQPTAPSSLLSVGGGADSGSSAATASELAALMKQLQVLQKDAEQWQERLGALMGASGQLVEQVLRQQQLRSEDV